MVQRLIIRYMIGYKGIDENGIRSSYNDRSNAGTNDQNQRGFNTYK
ncbi:hypothetical protein KHA80_22940 [Anaerobacillus sp. HL2]|nr:hypothetical protein KHA80_22940 [Anaerobacillus sp. HL2]